MTAAGRDPGVRPRQELDGRWQFHLDCDAPSFAVAGLRELPPGEAWSDILVPGAWQDQRPELRHHAGAAWYRRRLAPPPADVAGLRPHLLIAAASPTNQVWCNDALLAQWEGGHLPVQFPLADHLTGDGSDQITVRTVTPSRDERIYQDGTFGEVPHGKQSWYGAVGGLWQPVTVEWRHPAHVRVLRVRTDGRNPLVSVEAEVTGEALRSDARLVVDVLREGEEVASAELAVDGEVLDLAVDVGDPEPWSPASPVLYDVRVGLVLDGLVVDEQRRRIGFRTLEASEGRLLLNREPLYLRGVLDQDYWDQSGVSLPDVEALRRQLQRVKDMGFNLVRLHVKAPDPRYLDLADEIGLLVWAELPSFDLLTDASKRRARATLAGMVERDGHHASLVIWTIANEAWGVDVAGSPDDRQWLVETQQWLRSLDDRLVVDNSACPGNFHLVTDLEDFHYYASVPEHRAAWDRFVEAFAARSPFTFSPHGDAQRRGDEPLVLSEFGGWGLPRSDQFRDTEDARPWWFATGEEWADGAAHVRGVEERFAQWHLDRVFGPWAEFIKATQLHQWRTLRYQIESLRRQRAIAGYVVTELTDVYWEANGLLDMARRPKLVAERVHEVNADDVLILKTRRPAVFAGDEAEVEVALASVGRDRATGLTWELAGVASGESGELVTEPGGDVVTDLGVLRVPTPAPPHGGRRSLQVTATLASGATRCATVELVAPERPDPSHTGPVAAQGPHIAEFLGSAGYEVVGPGRDVVLVADVADAAVMERVRGGGRVVLLADHAAALGSGLPGFPPLTLEPWEDALYYGGDWISSFPWLRRDGPFGALPGGPLLGLEFDGVLPEFLLTGAVPSEFRSHVHAGVFLGWLHRNAGIVVERRYGQGRIVLSTFALRYGEWSDGPAARIITDGLLRLAADASA